MAAATGTVVIAQTGSNFDSATYPRFVLGDGTNTLTFVIDNDARGLKLTGGADATGYSSGSDLPFEDSQRGRLVVPTYDEADGAKKAILAWLPTDYGNLTTSWTTITANDGSSGLIAIGSRPHYVIRDVDGEEIKIGFGISTATALTNNNAVLLAKYNSNASTPRYYLYSETSGSRNYFIRVVTNGSNRWRLSVAFMAAIKHANDNGLIKVEAKGIGITGSLETLSSVANNIYTDNEIWGVLLQAEDAGYKGNASSMEFKDPGSDFGVSDLKEVSWGYDEYLANVGDTDFDDITRHTLSPTNAQFWHGAEDTKIYFRQGTIAGSGSDASLSTAQIAEAIKDMINGSVLGITASRSSSTVNLTNDTDGNSGNVTITTTNEGSLFSVSGMSNAGGGDEVAKTFINNKQINITTALLPGSANAVDLGSSALEWNDIYLGDAAVIKFGSDQDVTMTHVPDVGLTITHTGTGDNLPVVLQLKSEEDAIIADEVIASVEFAAGDSDGTDGATVAAGIHAIAEETFAADANATKLVFTTADSETAAASATAKMTLASTGNLTLAGTLTAVTSIGIGSAILTEAELEMLDGISVGVGAASKALVLDANADIASGLRNVTISGTFSDGNYTFDDSGNVSGLGTVGCGAITSSGNLAVTGTLTGDTSLTLDTTTITTAEIGVLDGVTAGAAAASKAVVLDGSKNIATIGTLGCGAITSTGSSSFGASTLASLTCTAAATFGGGIGSSGATITAAGAISADGRIVTDDTTPATTTTDGSLQTDGGLSVALDAVVGDDLILLSENAQIAFGADSEVTLAHVPDSGLLMASAVTAVPVFELRNTNADATGATLKLNKNGASPADGDICGNIDFASEDDASNAHTFARINATIDDASSGAEQGGLDFYVAANDGTLAKGLQLQGTTAAGVVDVTLGLGSASTTTVAGNLTVTGTTTTVNSTVLSVADDLITVSKGNDTVANADGSGMEIDVTGGTNLYWKYVHSNTALSANTDIDAASGKAYKIAGTSVLNANTLGSGVSASSLTSVGTIATGVWNGTAVASAYLDADTAHLSTSQTFTGAKTFTSTVTTGVDGTGVDVKMFGDTSGAYLEWDQSADELEIRGGAATPGKLLLATAETTVVDGDKLGQIDFQAPLEASATDAILVAASIWAEADDTFAADNNDTDLVFATGKSAAASEKMRLNSDGDLNTAGSITAVGSFIIGSADLNEADMEKLDGITNGTVAASKAVVADANADVSGFRNVTATGSFIIGSASMNEADLEKLDGITNGTAAASKAVVLDASKNIATIGTLGCGAITSTGTSVFASLDISGDIDVDGTTNLDAVDIDGAVQLDNTFTVGADDQGYDVKFFGDTASAYMMWDTSADDLILGGAARAVVPDGQLVLGSTAVSSTAAELNFLDGFADAAYTIGADSVVFFDADDSKLKRESAADFASAIAGNGLTASSGALTIAWESERFTKANVDSTTAGNPTGGALLTIQVAQTPLGDSEMVFLNGMLLTAEESSGSAGDHDYAISGAVITFESEVVDLMDSDDVISVQYVRQ